MFHGVRLANFYKCREKLGLTIRVDGKGFLSIRSNQVAMKNTENSSA